MAGRDLFVGLVLVSIALVSARHADVADALSKLQKKQDIPDFANMDMSDLGSGFEESLDFICNTFCTKPEPAVSAEELAGEIATLKQLVVTQTSAIESLEQAVATKQTGSDVIPIEYREAYPVFLVESPYGHYQYTLEDARQACQAKGARLATYKQMEAAWERGMDYCSCGWIEEGYALYPIWYSREGCTNKIGSGIRYNCTWQSTWNAWCFSYDKANKEEL